VFALIPVLKKFPNTTVDAPPGVTWEHLAFNLQDPVMKDVNVRKAIAVGIDPNELIKKSTVSTTRPLFSFLVPEQKPYYTPAWAAYKHSAAKVAQYMKAAGFKTIAGNATRESNFKLMKAQLQKVGIKITTSFDDNFFDANGPLNTGKYQVGEYAFSSSADPDNSTLFRSDVIPTKANGYSGQNTYRVQDKTLDSLMAKANLSIAVGERVSLTKQIQARIANNMVLMPLYQRPEVTAYASNLNGVIVNPTQVGSTDKTEGWNYTGGNAVR
jgi:peptide/nickel transport system substrate-binding protein